MGYRKPEKKEEKLKVTTVDMHSSETLIATTQEKVDGLKDKLIDGSISNNKEYDDMMDTIDYEKNIIFEKENELLVLMETKETLSKEIDEDKAALDGIIEELNFDQFICSGCFKKRYSERKLLKL